MAVASQSSRTLLHWHNLHVLQLHGQFLHLYGAILKGTFKKKETSESQKNSIKWYRKMMSLSIQSCYKVFMFKFTKYSCLNCILKQLIVPQSSRKNCRTMYFFLQSVSFKILQKVLLKWVQSLRIRQSPYVTQLLYVSS